MLLEVRAYVLSFISLRTLFPRLAWARGNSKSIVRGEMCPSQIYYVAIPDACAGVLCRYGLAAAQITPLKGLVWCRIFIWHGLQKKPKWSFSCIFFKNGATQLWSDSPQLLYSTVGSIIQEEHGQAGMHPEWEEETGEEDGSQIPHAIAERARALQPRKVKQGVKLFVFRPAKGCAKTEKAPLLCVVPKGRSRTHGW